MSARTSKKVATTKAPAKTQAPKSKAPVKTATKSKTVPQDKTRKHSKVFLFVREFMEESGNSKLVSAWDENEVKLNKLLKTQEKTLERKKKDPNAPRKPQSAYLIFCNENRGLVKEQNPEIVATDVMRKLSEMWKEVKADKKKSQLYMKKAERAREEYLKQMEEYTPPPGFGKKKEPKVKRPPTGYILYCNDNRPRVKEDNPEFKTTDIMRELGKLWTDLDAETKQAYLDRASEAKASMSGTVPAPVRGKKSTPPPRDEDMDDDLEEDDE